MIVEIKNTKNIIRKEGNKKYTLCGLTTFYKNGKATVLISEKENTTIALFSTTLLHELLHIWLEVIKQNGATIDLRKDHKFITAVETSVIKLAKLLKRGTNEKKK